MTRFAVKKAVKDKRLAFAAFVFAVLAIFAIWVRKVIVAYFAGLCGLSPVEIGEALRKGDIDRAKLICRLSASAALNPERGATGRHPIHVAALSNSEAGIDLVVSYGANLESKDMDGNTPLHLACDKGAVEAVLCLIAHGACVNRLNHYDEPAILFAVKSDHAIIVRILLEHGANPRLSDGYGDILHWAVNLNRANIVRLLLGRRWHNFETLTSNGDKYIDLAIDKGNKEIADLILSASDDNKPFRYSVAFESAETVRRLINSDKLSLRDVVWQRRRTPLHLAASLGRDEIVSVLVDGGCDPSSQDVYNQTALHRAVKWCSPITVAKLIVSGKLDLQDTQGRTPLHYAILSDRLDNAVVLVEHNARCDIKDFMGETQMDFARFYGGEAFVDLLQGKGHPVLTPFKADEKLSCPQRDDQWQK